MAHQIRTAEERIKRSHFQIMKHPEFCVWSGLLYIGSWKISDYKTACVRKNGDTEYGRAFLEKLGLEINGTDVELNFLVLHEKGHMALLHTTRSVPLKKKNLRAACIAVDQVVNNLIVDADPDGAFARMPVNKDGPYKGQPMGHLDRRFKDMSLNEVFNILLKEAQDDDDPRDGFDEHDWEGGEQDEISEADIREVEAEIEASLRTGAHLAGKLGSKNARNLAGVLDAPRIDWRDQLAEFITDTCQGEGNATWRRPLRRFVGEGNYMPSSVDESVGEIVFALDTSGSVGDAELQACLSEGVGLCRALRPALFRLIYWDVGVRREEIYLPEHYDNIVALTKPEGGGGTDIRDVAKHVNSLKDVQCCVIATDGYIYGGWGVWNCSTLWAVTNRRNVAPFGKTIHLEV